ncbi:MAG: hypothetical protein IMZ53_15980 [Thermoplasmata archaeon]|nr:hypothetical protein [Thermoplasmata archaeon]
MSKIKDAYQFLGAVIWMKWCEDFHLRLPALRSLVGWTSPIFFLVGLVGYKYYRLSRLWTDLQIRWAIGMMRGGLK